MILPGLPFPHLSADRHGSRTATRVKNLLSLRNRVSYMESRLDVDMVQRYDDVLQLP